MFFLNRPSAFQQQPLHSLLYLQGILNFFSERLGRADIILVDQLPSATLKDSKSLTFMPNILI